MSGQSLNDRCELQKLTAVFLEEAVELHRMIDIIGIYHRHRIPFYPVFLQQFDALHHLLPRWFSRSRQPVMVMIRLLTIDRDAYQPMVLGEKLAPFIDEWCEFFAQNHWLVGISIDGQQPDHDHYRLTAAGKPSWKKVMQGIKLLKKHGVEWNAMAVVNAYNVNHPMEFYRFFKENGCQFLQFTPIVERLTRHEDGRTLASLADKNEIPLSEASVTPEQWGYFLCAIFDEWVRKDVGKIFVEIFDCTLANWMGISPGICAYSKECGHAGVMEHNGDVYSCDHFVFPEYKLGNIRDHSLIDMLYGEQQHEFSRLKHSSLPRQCKECDMEFACHGECPKNRFMKDKYGDSGLNYLCPGYYHYYQHVAPYMDYMKQELMSQRPPSNIMKVVQ